MRRHQRTGDAFGIRMRPIERVEVHFPGEEPVESAEPVAVTPPEIDLGSIALRERGEPTGTIEYANGDKADLFPYHEGGLPGDKFVTVEEARYLGWQSGETA